MTDIHQLVSLRVLRAEAEKLTPTAARIAAAYIPLLNIGDLWQSALTLTLNRRSAFVGPTPLPDLQATFGQPGAWTRAAHLHDDASRVRLFIAGLQAIAADYTAPPSTAP